MSSTGVPREVTSRSQTMLGPVVSVYMTLVAAQVVRVGGARRA
nr:MAG TPA: hypothetical protein [Caudoviricetes sp.]